MFQIQHLLLVKFTDSVFALHSSLSALCSLFSIRSLKGEKHTGWFDVLLLQPAPRECNKWCFWPCEKHNSASEATISLLWTICGRVKPLVCLQGLGVYSWVYVCVSNPSFRARVPALSVCMQPEITWHDLGQVYRILRISVQSILWVCAYCNICTGRLCVFVCVRERKRKSNTEIKKCICICERCGVSMHSYPRLP